MTKEPFASILIPVFNGEKYLERCVQSALSQAGPTIEIIICDDNSNDNSWKLMNKFKDPRVKVLKNLINLGMKDNYEHILSKASGQWITILGQDDFLTSNSIFYLHKFSKKKPENEIFVSPRSYYFWNDSSRKNKKFFSLLNLGIPVAVEKRSNIRLIKTLLGFVYYNTGPQLYTGTFVKKNLIEKIKRNQGNFFVGRIPDVASAVSLMVHSSKYCQLGLSLAVVGTSEDSVGYNISNFVKSKNKFKQLNINNYFSRNNPDAVNQPGFDGRFSSFIFYFYEESLNFTKIYDSAIIGSITTTKFFKFLLYSNVTAELFQNNPFIHKNQLKTLNEIMNNNLLIILIMYSAASAICVLSLLARGIKYFYLFTLWLAGRYKINSLIDEEI